MGRPNGGTNRKYTIEQKEETVRMYLEGHLSPKQIEKIKGINHSNIERWIAQYQEKGIEGLKDKKRTGNRFAALHTSKSLTREERLELENLKLRIENERLKKGYQMKGVGANKEYVSILEKNMRSSKN